MSFFIEKDFPPLASTLIKHLRTENANFGLNRNEVDAECTRNLATLKTGSFSLFNDDR